MYNEKPHIDFFSVIFIFAEVLFIITIIAILSNILNIDNITTNFAAQPTASIANLRTSIPEVSSEMAATIENQLYTVLLSNSSTGSISHSATAASVAEDSVKRNHFDTRGGVTLISAAIDIPALAQSYSFFYGYPEEGNNDFQLFYAILCPVSSNVGSYPDFNCRNYTTGDVNKDSIVSSFLSYFGFEYFSTYMDPTNPNRIIISPSITYDNDQKTKDNFIEETKTAIESLGIDADDYEYHVRTAADIDYENKDR